MGQPAKLWRGQISSLGAARVGFLFTSPGGETVQAYQPVLITLAQQKYSLSPERCTGLPKTAQVLRQSQASQTCLAAPESQGLGKHLQNQKECPL